MGCTCLIHAGEDDGSQPAGNAGARIAAGQLGYANPTTDISVSPPVCIALGCCEDDCCAKDTSWDADSQTFVFDLDSSGYASGCEDVCNYSISHAASTTAVVQAVPLTTVWMTSAACQFSTRLERMYLSVSLDNTFFLIMKAARGIHIYACS